MNELKRKNISLSEYFAFRESIGEETLKNIYNDAMAEIEKEAKNLLPVKNANDIQSRKIV